MALIEIDEDEARTSHAAKVLLDKFYNNPKTRRNLLKLVKELNPDAAIPELDVAGPLENDVRALREEFTGTVSELKAELAKRDRASEIDTLIASERGKLKKAGWDDEGIAEVEQAMSEHGVHSYAMAAAFVDKQKKAPEAFDPVKSFDRGWNMGVPEEADTDHKLWLKNPRAAQDLEVRKFFAERQASR